MSTKNSSLKSLTAFVQKEYELGELRLKLSLGSVNHRFFECRSRLPRQFQSLDVAIKKELKKGLKRGACDFQIEFSNVAKESDQSQNLLSAYQEVLKNKNVKNFSFLEKLTLPSLLARHSDLWWKNAPSSKNNFKNEDLLEALQTLIQAHQEQRTLEGESLVPHIEKYLKELDAHKEIIKNKIPDLNKQWQEQKKDRLLEIKKELDNSDHFNEDRIHQELAILAEKKDVSEELQRIDAHLKTFQEILHKEEELKGKKIEFYVQELQREWTTLGNKIKEAEVLDIIIEAKLTVEKLKEQALNIL